MERGREEVREWLVRRIESWMTNASDGFMRDTLAHIRNDIEDEIMLSKSQAKLVEEYLQIELGYELEEIVGHNRNNIILQVDALSIYPDAWALYCRPGTYIV